MPTVNDHQRTLTDEILETLLHMLRWTQANAREGWEFHQIVDFGEGGNVQLLLRRLV
jgi:hypothetical protein